MRILLIAGHGEGDPGAVANGCFEAALTRELVALLKVRLEKFADTEIYDTSKNMYRHLSDGETFNFKAYDYVFEVHFNAAANDSKGNGITTGSEIYVHPKEAIKTAEENVLKNICALGYKNRGVKTRSNLLNMNICKGRQGVSYALLETCFIDDKDDMVLYQKKKAELADAIARGIKDGFGIKTADDNHQEVIKNDQPGEWSSAARAWAEANGIVKGDENGNMNYKDAVTREQAVQMLYNFSKTIK